MKKIKFTLSATIILAVIAVVIACGDRGPRGVPNFANAEATYKARCQMCHQPNAGKFFDSSKEEAALVDAILKGRSMVRPPMPSFAAEGMTADQARALVEHMKKLGR